MGVIQIVAGAIQNVVGAIQIVVGAIQTVVGAIQGKANAGVALHELISRFVEDEK